jgi:hypothetical protein
MKALKMALIVAAAGISLCIGGLASAADHYRGSGHYGGRYSAGGHYSGHYRGGGHYSGSHFRVVVGGPFWGPSWYYNPYYSPYYYPYYWPYYSPYYYPYVPEVTVPSRPQEYIERTEPNKAVGTPSGVWYYCPQSQAYYPYVKECPGGWQTVPASPQAGSDESATQSDLWHYCPQSKAYYPYVKECPGGWQTVPAQSPSDSGR